MSLANICNVLGRGAKIPAGGGTPIAGTIAATQVAYGSAANTIKGTAGFTFTEGTGLLALTGNLAVSGTFSTPKASSAAGYLFSGSTTNAILLADNFDGNAYSNVMSFRVFDTTSSGAWVWRGANTGTTWATLYSGTGGQFALFATTEATTGGVGSFTTAGGIYAAKSLALGSKILGYNGVATAGWGVPAIQAATEVTAQSAANASIATYTVGAADGTFAVSAQLDCTAATVLSTSLFVTYTDKSNTSRTMIFPVAQLAGSFIAAGAITGTGAWETPVMHIRCKASTAITIGSSAGTFNTVTYSADGVIKQVA